MAATKESKTKKIRQDQLRAFMSQQGKLIYVFDNIKKIEGPLELDAIELKRLEVATNMRIKLLDFYMPKLKAVEMTGEDGKDLFPSKITIQYE